MTGAACPPSAVVDMIVSWTESDGTLNVHPGDLILWVSQMMTVKSVEPHTDGLGVMVALDTSIWPTYITGDRLVAVRRYTEG